MVINNPFPEVVIPDLPVVDYMFKQLDKYGDDIAMIDGLNEKKKFTFKQVKELSISSAKAFASLGICRGDFIATCFSNCLEFPIIAIAASACGAATTSCNPNFTEDELKAMFNNTKPKVVFIDGHNYEKMKRVESHITSIKHIIAIDETSKCRTFEKLLRLTAHKDYPRNIVYDKNDVFFLPYSSGTTGLPKGVMITQRNMVAAGELFKIGIPLSRRDVHYSVSPMFHILGSSMTLHCLVQGSKLVVDKRFSVDYFFQCVEKYKITSLVAVPPMLLAIYNSPKRSNYDLSSLRKVLCGAAPLQNEVVKEVKRALNLEVFQVWGLTEGLYSSSCVDPLIPSSSAGSVLPNSQIKVVEVETGKELGPYQNGEIWGKSPMIMRGYYKNPEATAQSIDVDGWLHTGDIGYYDKYGNLYIIDRLKELIKYKGFQVAPAELEELLLQHPKIIDAAVTGVPDKEAGELPKAFVVRKDDSICSEDIHQFVKGKVASYKYFRGGISFRDSIPKSPSGKILRRQLKAMEIKSKL